MYLQYWNLDRHPFNNVPDPAMYFNMHHSVDEAVSETLFAIEEGDECLAVIVGPVGVGKTTCLRIVLDALDHEKYRIAFVTNPDMTFPQLLREIVGQLEGRECTERGKNELLESFNRILFDASNEGKRVVIFIDEGNVIKPTNLNSMRLLTNMQDDHRNLFTIVLAGQPELSRRLEHAKMANLFQRIGVYCQVQGIGSRDVMKDYVEHRLERAGAGPGRRIFTEDAFDALWELSEGGIPRLINKVCKLSLKAGETNRLAALDGEVVRAVAHRFDRVYRDLYRKPRTTTGAEPGPENVPAIPSGQVEVEQAASAMKAVPERKETETEETERHAGKRGMVEIDPVEEEREFAEMKYPGMPDPKDKNDEECIRIAGEMASRIVAGLPTVVDPFEEWTKTKDDILAEMKKLKSVEAEAGIV